MLELKNVSKTYKSKKGNNTKALDDISLNFDEKGMTFILGKSGSGKSTLLNILGGLDKYDTGDMIISGKSNKDFSNQDLDCYRNTYVGFVFQEFNLLEDYDVYENIVLALQLQQKQIDDKKVDDLLVKLDIIDLKKRKVNELSGGQKQRVAIARSLIKDPKIILADEPTGNLDSKTGKEVMNLLKDISKEKLVILVSHDEESAKTYGDRVIEIKDGHIVSDTAQNKKIMTTKNSYNIISSKLPFRESLKLGVGSLRNKKLKLFFTIILIIITLGFLSASDTLANYDYHRELEKITNEKKDSFVEVVSNHVVSDEGFMENTTLSLKDEQEKLIEKTFGKKGNNVYEFSEDNCYGLCSIENTFHIQSKNNMVSDSTNIQVVTTNDISQLLKENIIGKQPQNSNEVVISNYIANQIIDNGVEVYESVIDTEFSKSNVYVPKSYEDILNTNYTYHFGNVGKVKIVGIIDYDLNNKTEAYISNVYNKVFVQPSFIENLQVTQNSLLNNKYSYSIKYDDHSKEPINIMNVGALNKEIEYFDGTDWKKISTLEANQIILNIDMLASIDENYYTNLNNYLANNLLDYETAVKKFNENYIRESNIIGRKMHLDISYGFSDGFLAEKFENLTIIGVFTNDYNFLDENDNVITADVYFNKNIVQEYVNLSFRRIGILYPVKDINNFQKVSKQFPYMNDLSLKTSYSNTLYSEAVLFKSMSKIAFYISLVFLLFTVILVMNFMFNSVSYRKKEIGILRALGAKTVDVVKIFIWEVIGISVLSGTIASVLLIITSNLVNQFLQTMVHIISIPFLVGIRQFLVIYIVVFLLTILSSVLPIVKVSKMKPIDAILNK